MPALPPAAAPAPELIADYACHTGEGPLWHPTEQKLYWCDIPHGEIYRYDPAQHRHETFHVGGVIGGFTFQADGALLLFMDRGAIRTLKDGRLATLVESIPGEEDTRFNDVIADPAGGVFCGTMASPTHPGHLYRLSRDGRLTKLLDEIGCSNGLGFTLDRRSMYYTDTTARKIYLFDYDAATGAIANQRVWVDTTEDSKNGGGYPDGMTVDAEGCVWSARWDGSCLVRYSPEGREIARYPLPAKKVSSVCFGGPTFDEMYVTTAGGHLKESDGPQAGALFRLRLNVRGLPEFLSRIRL
ncbi:MAG: SMP-30/gluconolactonase/LRE family protein [Planctomycetota bacterium]